MLTRSFQIISEIVFTVNQPTEKVSQSIITVSKVIQDHVETLVIHDSSAENRIISLMLQCLDLLYSNFPEHDSNTLEVSFVVHISSRCLTLTLNRFPFLAGLPMGSQNIVRVRCQQQIHESHSQITVRPSDAK